VFTLVIQTVNNIWLVFSIIITVYNNAFNKN